MAKDKEKTFKIKRVYAGQKSSRHIPYYKYMIVEGPRGGKYLVDLYNLGLLMKAQYDEMEISGFGRVEQLILSYARRHSLIVIENHDRPFNDKELVELAKRINAKPLVRNKSRTDFYMLANKIDFKDLIVQEVAV